MHIHILYPIYAQLLSASCPENFGMRLRLSPFTLLIGFPHQFFKISLLTNSYMVRHLITQISKLLVVHVLFSLILANTLNLNLILVSVVSRVYGMEDKGNCYRDLISYLLHISKHGTYQQKHHILYFVQVRQYFLYFLIFLCNSSVELLPFSNTNFSTEFIVSTPPQHLIL